MSSYDFFPYVTSPRSIQLHLTVPDLDLEAKAGQTLRLFDQDWTRVIVEADAILPHDAFETLPKVEHNTPRVALYLIWQSIESRRRFAVRLHGDGAYTGQLELIRSDWFGRAEVQAVLIRSARGNHEEPGFAADVGAILAWSQPISVQFDEQEPPPGEYLEIIWRDFTDGEPWLRRQKDHLFAVDTSREPARLILNKAFPHAHRVLMNKGTRGLVARIRDMTYGMIVHQTWPALLSSALTDLAALLNGQQIEDPRSALEQLHGWQQAIVREWAPSLYPGMDTEEALAQLLDDLAIPEWSQKLLVHLMPEAVQRRIRTMDYFSRIIDEVR